MNTDIENIYNYYHMLLVVEELRLKIEVRTSPWRGELSLLIFDDYFLIKGVRMFSLSGL